MPTMTATPSLLFVVGTRTQLDSAQRIADHLKRDVAVLDIWRGAVTPIGDVTVPGHLAPVSLARLRMVASVVAHWAVSVTDAVVVAPQDVGLVYRRVIAAARRGGARIAFLPDGAVSDSKVTGRGSLGGLVPIADAVLRGVGLVAGRHGEMGASRPDVVLSWGPAWDSVYKGRGAGKIVDVGNPRADDLAKLPPPTPGRILICSQPMDHAVIGGSGAEKLWCEFLDRMATSAPADALAIRLHPAEKDKLAKLPFSAAVRERLTQDTSLSDDIGWSGAVVSWASTTMIEAAGARRAVVSVAVNDAAAELAKGYFFQRDPRAICMLTDQLPDFAALNALVDQAREKQAGMADEYLINVGTAAKTAAQVLDQL